MDLMDIINNLRSGVDYGVVNMQLKYHDSELSTVDATKMSSYKTPQGNTEALALVTHLMKAVQNANETATLTFSIAFEKGRANRVMVQDFKRVNIGKK